MTARTIIWFSTGAASAIAARLALRETPDAIIARCETGNEDPDNYRFEADVMRWLNTSITILASDKYKSVPEVWEKRRYMAGVEGALCTVEMKVMPRLAFQHPTDIHVFGYTTDKLDVKRFELLRDTYPELTIRAPLIEHGISKAASMAMIERAGIALPRSYAMGFPNANCLKSGCVKATSPDYWALYRHHFPEGFARTAATARALDVRLCRIKDERRFIDEIPADHPMTKPIVPACDFLCHIAEQQQPLTSYRDWEIWPNPNPLPGWEWIYHHKDYAGSDRADDDRQGQAASVDACMAAVDEWHNAILASLQPGEAA